MSDEMELPQGVTNKEWIEATNKVCLGGWDAGVGFFGRHPRLGFACATTIQCDLDKASAQIAALSAQVEALTLSLASANYAVKVGERDRNDLETELAVLREGATVTWRVEGLVSKHGWRSIHVHDDLVDAGKSLTPGSNRRIVEVTTRERILDAAEPNKGDQRDR